MATTPKSVSEILKGADKDEDGRYALSEDDIAELIAGVCMRLRTKDAAEPDETDIAQDHARRLAHDEMFPNSGRLVDWSGRVRETPPTKAAVTAREERFPNANRLGR